MLIEMLIVAAVSVYAVLLLICLWKKKIRLLCTGMLLLCLGAVSFCLAYRVECVQTTVVVELGGTVSDNPKDYFEGFSFAVKQGTVDITRVNENRPGDYEIQLSHGWQRFQCRVTVQDTVAPVLSVSDKPVYLKNGAEYEADYFVETVEELSGKVSFEVSRTDWNVWNETVTFHQNGTYDVKVSAVDRSGNRAEEMVTVVVDRAPKFAKLPEYYVAVGSKADYLEGVSAYDETDGDVTEQISVDTAALTTETAGEYSVFYSVSDAYGLTEITEHTVHVMEPLKLQGLINHHQINQFDQKIVGAPNVHDAGVYEDMEIPELLDIMEPTMVCLRRETEDGYSRGSGFIIDITEEELIICTNHHVVRESSTLDVYFYDGTKAVANRVASKEMPDIGFVSVELSELPGNSADTLRTVHIDKGVWDKLEDNDGTQLGMRTINKNGKVWKDKEGELLLKSIVYLGALSKGESMEVSIELYNGASGSAVLDSCGNLIGMAAFITGQDEDARNWCVPLEPILTYFEEVYGRPVHYQ